MLEKTRHPNGRDAQKGSFLGPEFSPEEIQLLLDEKEVDCERMENETELVAYVAQLLAEEKVVGWFRGRMEFGPRALARIIQIEANEEPPFDV